MECDIWLQAVLPTSKGGLGIRRSSEIALPAFLASLHATQDLFTAILPPGELDDEVLLQEALDIWVYKCGQPLLPEESRSNQHLWDQPLTEHSFQSLLDAATDPSSRARLLATATKESGAWLNTLTVPHLGTKLDDDSIHIAIGLRWVLT